MDYNALLDLYKQVLNLTLAMLPIAVIAGGYMGYVIGKIVESKRIMKEISTLEDDDE